MNINQVTIKILILLSTMMTIAYCFHSVEAANVNVLEEDLLFNKTARESYESAMSVYREPSSWFQTILKEFFVDIDWKTIADAREQVTKFLGKLDTFWAVFKSTLPSSYRTNSNKANKGSEESRLFMAKLFGSSSSTTTPTPTSSSSTSQLPFDDSTNVKAMLERVACFVGYMRLLTQTQAAIADLDSSKVLSNLFTSSSKDKTSSSYFSNWFG